MGRPPLDYAVEQAVIGDHPHIIVGPADHPLARRKRVALTDLADETFLLREQGSGTRGLMQRLFADAGLSPNLGMEIGSNETIKQAVIAGLGIALISAHTVSAEIADGRLAVLPVKGLPIVRQWFVVRPQDKRLLPAAQALWDFLAASGAAYLPDAPLYKTPRRRKA
jgi:LysR family transcriptional regulator for metE and metH